MYVYCVYPAMSKKSENLSDLNKKDRNKRHSSPFINVVYSLTIWEWRLSLRSGRIWSDICRTILRVKSDKTLCPTRVKKVGKLVRFKQKGQKQASFLAFHKCCQGCLLRGPRYISTSFILVCIFTDNVRILYIYCNAREGTVTRGSFSFQKRQ
jgi:hypothetical protein